MASYSFDESNLYIISTMRLRFQSLMQIGILISRRPFVDTFKTYKGLMGIFKIDMQFRKRSLIRRLLKIQWGNWRPLASPEDLFVVRLEDRFVSPKDLPVVSFEEDNELNKHAIWTKDQIQELVRYHLMISKALTAKIETS